MDDAQRPAGPPGTPLQSTDQETAPGPSTLLVVLGLVIAGSVALVLAYCRMYSTFPWYDDDGYLLISLRSFLGGHPLYNETYSNYGPFYYLWRFVIHALLGVPLTHDATRMVALFEWALCGLLATLLIRRGTGDSLFGIAGGLLVFLFLEPVTKEPSHPQLLAMVVTLGAAWAFTGPVVRRSGTLIAGLLVGSLLAIKPNLGVFAGLGLVLAHARWVGGGFALTGIGLAAIALPILIMRSGFAEPTTVAYAATCALAVLAQTVDRRRPCPSPAGGCSRLIQDTGLLALGAGAGYLGSAAFALSRGTTVAALFDGVMIRPMQFASTFAGPMPFPTLTAAPALLAAVGAVWVSRSAHGSKVATTGGTILGLVVLGVASVGFLVTGCTHIERGEETRAFAGWLLALGTPWAFLLHIPGAPAPERLRAREMLVALAVTHMAIGFPAAGTQLSCGACFLVLAALPAAHDALSHDGRKTLPARVALALALLAALIPAGAALATYRTFTSVGLPGASLLRVEPELSSQFQTATAILRTNGGPFVTVYGVNSLYLWAEMDPPTAANATLWPWMLNDAEQSAIVAALERDPRSAALVIFGGPYLNSEATNHILGRWIRDRTAPAMEVGSGKWQLRRRVPAQVAP